MANIRGQLVRLDLFRRDSESGSALLLLLYSKPLKEDVAVVSIGSCIVVSIDSSIDVVRTFGYVYVHNSIPLK